MHRSWLGEGGGWERLKNVGFQVKRIIQAKSSHNRKAGVVKVHEGRGAWPERQSGGTLGATLKIPSLF